MNGPQRPALSIIPGMEHHRLIRGVLRVEVDPLHIARIDLIQTPDLTVSLIDTGGGDAEPWSTEGDTTLHVLWEQDEENAAIFVRDNRFPIAPGDSMSVPAGTPVRFTGGMLLIQITIASSRLGDILAPDHGIEAYEGYNRRTDYETPEGYVLQRWKITQPLRLDDPGHAYAIVSIATPLSLIWSGGTDRIGPGECRLIHRETASITLLPDGLGYALIMSLSLETA